MGDNIYVLGNLGQSAIGLDILQNKINIEDKISVKSHLMPKLFYAEFQDIISKYEVNASIDISDGLLQDLSHIAVLSNVVCEVYDYANYQYVNNVYKNIDESDEGKKKQILEYILAGGEDYAICFTSPDIIQDKENIICVGKVRKLDKDEKASVILYDRDRQIYDIKRKGYTH